MAALIAAQEAPIAKRGPYKKESGLMSEIELFASPIAIPFVFLIAAWLAFSRRKPMTKVWASGIATLISLPAGLVIVGIIYLPPYDPAHEPTPSLEWSFFLSSLAGWYAWCFGRC